jgi:hypothetical protein
LINQSASLRKHKRNWKSILGPGWWGLFETFRQKSRKKKKNGSKTYGKKNLEENLNPSLNLNPSVFLNPATSSS